MGHKVFEKFSENITSNQQESPIFYLSVGEGKAACVQTSDGFVLLKGSHIHESATNSLNIGLKKRVESSKANGEIIDNILQKDKSFSSSSAAAAFAVGYSISGPKQWKTEKGETLKSFETRKH